MTKDNANKSTRSGNNTPGQTHQGGGGQLREGADMGGNDPHLEDRTGKRGTDKTDQGNRSADGSTRVPPKWTKD